MQTENTDTYRCIWCGSFYDIPKEALGFVCNMCGRTSRIVSKTFPEYYDNVKIRSFRGILIYESISDND